MDFKFIYNEVLTLRKRKKNTGHEIKILLTTKKGKNTKKKKNIVKEGEENANLTFFCTVQ